MTHFEKIGKIRTPLFCSLLTPNEFIEVNNNTVSIIDPSTQLCKIFYFLPAVPKFFTISPQNPDRYVLVYPATASTGETLVVLDTKTGKIEKKITLKQSYPEFGLVGFGTHVYFTLASYPTIVFITQPVGGSVKQFELPCAAVFMVANPTAPQVLVVRQDKHLVVINATSDLKAVKDIAFNDFSFIRFTGNVVTYGSLVGELIQLKLDTGETKNTQIPHGTRVVSVSESFALTTDGILFNTESGDIISHIFNPKSVHVKGNNLAIVCKDDTFFYQIVQHPICTHSQFQPPEPFIGEEYLLEPTVLFASSAALYSFNLSSNSVSKFTDIKSSAKKIANSSAVISYLYSTPEGDRIATYATGTLRRDEFGIDVSTDQKNNTWILQKDALLCFQRKQLNIIETKHINLPEDHQYNRVFRLGETIAIYSSELGTAAYVKEENLVTFTLPQRVNVIRWPALCTSDSLFICQSDDENYENLEPTHFIKVDIAISSCCWLAYTLFAIEKRIVYAIGRNGRKRALESLPNNLCTIISALPSQLTFVTSIPDIRIVTIKRPNLFDVLGDIPPSGVKYIPYILNFLPSNLRIDPRSINGLTPLLMMSIFVKDPPKYLTNEVVDCYSRFARFAELRNMVTQYHQKDMLKRIAYNCRKIGQFHIAQQIYEELEDYENLFELFLVTIHRHNIGVLANRSKLRDCIKNFFNIDPVEGEYEPLSNNQLPRIAQCINQKSFSLLTGDEEYSTSMLPCNFDELTDFGNNEYPLIGEEREAEQNREMEDMFDQPTPSPAEPPPTEETTAETVKSEPSPAADLPDETAIERKKILEEKPKEKEGLAAFFDDDDEEEKKGPALNFTINMPADGQSRRRRKGTMAPPVFNFAMGASTSDGASLRRRTVRNRKSDFNIPGIDDNETPAGSSDSETPTSVPPPTFQPPKINEGAEPAGFLDDSTDENNLSSTGNPSSILDEYTSNMFF